MFPGLNDQCTIPGHCGARLHFVNRAQSSNCFVFMVREHTRYYTIIKKIITPSICIYTLMVVSNVCASCVYTTLYTRNWTIFHVNGVHYKRVHDLWIFLFYVQLLLNDGTYTLRFAQRAINGKILFNPFPLGIVSILFYFVIGFLF